MPEKLLGNSSGGLLRLAAVAVLLALITILLTNLASSSADLRRLNSADAQAVSTPETFNSIGPLAETHSVRQLSVFTKDLAFDPTTARLYASVSSRGATTGNSIARIDPVTGVIESSVFVGSEPGKLALSSAAQILYVSLDGAAAVRRYDLATQTPGLQFALGDDNSGPYFVKDIAILPGDPNTVAVTRKNVTSSNEFEGVAVYDNGLQRPLTAASFFGSDFIGFSTSASTLYGFGFGTAGLQKMSVGSTGVTVTSSTQFSNVVAADFKIDNGLMYMPFGQVLNPESATLVGTFTFSTNGLAIVEPDSSVGRVYFLTGQQAFDDTTKSTLTLRAFDQNTFVPIGTLDIPNVTGRVFNLVRWGANGLAFGTTGGQLFLIQTTLVPSNEPVPSPTATPSPTPTPSPSPSPTPGLGELREVAITAKDIAISQPNQTIYASVPSSVGAGGNSITPIDPVSGTTGTPVTVGSEPNKLAISSDGQTIYVGLDGANSVRRFDVASGTAGQSFSVSDPQTQFVPVDLAVPPGQPQTVAVVRGNNPNSAQNVAVYDNGIARPNTVGVFHTINQVEFSASPLILYGNNNSNSEFGFRRMGIGACGLSMLSVKGWLLGGARDFQIEDGLAYASGGRVVNPETGILVGSYPISTGVDVGGSTTMFADSKTGRVYFFRSSSGPLDTSPQTVLLRAYDMRTFILLGSLNVPNISGFLTSVVRWGTNGFAFRTSANKVYLLQTSLIPPAIQPSPMPAPGPSPPTYTLRGSVSAGAGVTPPATTIHLSGGGINASLAPNIDGSFAFTGLPLCTDFTVTADPVENYSVSSPVTITAANQNNPNQSTAVFFFTPRQIGFTPGTSVSVVEGGTAVLTVRRFNDISTPATVMYQTGGGAASDRSDYTAALGTLTFAPNESTKQVSILTIDDVRDEPNETLTFTLSNPTGAFLGTQPSIVVTIADNDAADGLNNPADDARFFVRQHYLDFLNRNPDASGWDFWTNQITSCGADVGCTEASRVNVSASFFLSIEFQQTGYLVERVYKTSYGDATGTSTFNGPHQLPVPIVRFNEFLGDTQQITRGVIVLQPGWEQLLESNTVAFFNEFVQRSRFTTAFPTSMTPAEFVDKLNLNAGNILSASERTTAINLFSGAANTANNSARAQALRQVATDQDLQTAEFNRAFVLMQYFGYLRRNPNDPQDSDYTGYDFWLVKLNQFGGNYINAEMVKAFISSIEYRQRFGP